MQLLAQLPDQAKLWFYLADRPLSQQEEQRLRKHLTDFVGAWKAHGKELSAGFELLNHQVVVIGVDESAQVATGCSIDGQVRFMQQMGTEFGIDFFNRKLMAYESAEGIKVQSFDAVNALISQGMLSSDTLVLDHMAKNLGSFRNFGLLPLSDSWHMNLLQLPA
ncbi:MAG: hypothetical protein ACPF8V_07850 [Luteibaculum sp.]